VQTAVVDQNPSAGVAASLARSKCSLSCFCREASHLAKRSPFLGDELSAGTFGCGDDLVEALVTAQIIPARIEAEIAVCWGTPRHLRHNFQLLQRAVALARPRVNQRQVRDISRTPERVLGNRHEIDRAKCLADGVFFSAIKSHNLREVY